MKNRVWEDFFYCIKCLPGGTCNEQIVPTRHDSFGNLALHEKSRMSGERRAKNVKEYRGGDVIGNVAGYDVRSARKGSEIDVEHILLDDRNLR